MLVAITTLLAASATALADPPQSDGPPSRTELAAITERGRLLAEYDVAAWHGSDAAQAANPKAGSVVRWVARKTDAGWVVVFGKLSENQDAFLVACEAAQGKKPDEFTAKLFDPPRKDTGFFPAAAKGIDTSLKEFAKNFKGEQRPYNVAVLPAEKQQLWVYLVPAATQAGIYPLGADVRYLISPDGKRVVEKRQLHKAVIELQPPPGGKDNVMMGTHTHILDNSPQDTDVFHVLNRKPTTPEMIVTDKFVFMVETTGEIKYLGTPKEYLKQ
jgi:hypothetical protein